MQIQLGERILTSDGRDAALVDKVILDPEGHHVSSVVLRKGMLFPHDVEIQLDQLTEDDQGHHRLIFNAEQLDKLPAFEESGYTSPPLDLVLPLGYDHQMVLWPGIGATIPVPTEQPSIAGDPNIREETIGRIYAQDVENAVITSGSAIVSSDDERVGELEHLTFTDEGRLASIVVRQGRFFSTEVELPGHFVARAGDGILYLNIDQARVAELTRKIEE